ncbi:MAG: amidohydrolase [Pelosinus sp.]|jgi:aminobenzoyl-glutamate utilization protein A|nr:amidohydrolase [Pelosinus sp.]
MSVDIKDAVKRIENQIIGWRREFHQYPEAAWTEFRTADRVIKVLNSFGYEVQYGSEVVKEAAMMGVPSQENLDKNSKRAVEEGADSAVIGRMAGGKTGVVGTLRTGRPGPVVALRFDMDANEVQEKTDANHRPWQEGFASLHAGVMHACGHDGHTAIGLGLAKILQEKKAKLCGTVKLIFQPAEEGVRGAKAMVEAGVADDVDYLFGMHLGFLAGGSERFICGTNGFLATTKFDAYFQGVPAHAGAAPQEGRNALLAAANAAVNLHAIPRHAAGVSRINVGVLEAGSGRNVIADRAVLKLETRGETSAINCFMQEEALRVIQGAAAMQGVSVTVSEMGGAAGGQSDAVIASYLRLAAEASGLFTSIEDSGNLGASEDFTCFLERVQERGGQGGYAMVGINRAAGHHDGAFDFDEAALGNAVTVLVLAVVNLLQNR